MSSLPTSRPTRPGPTSLATTTATSRTRASTSATRSTSQDAPPSPTPPPSVSSVASSTTTSAPESAPSSLVDFPSTSTLPSNDQQNSPPDTRMRVIIPTTVTIGGVLFLLIAFQLFRRWKHQKQLGSAPLPPVRTPIIFEQRKFSSGTRPQSTVHELEAPAMPILFTQYSNAPSSYSHPSNDIPDLSGEKFGRPPSFSGDSSLRPRTSEDPEQQPRYSLAYGRQTPPRTLRERSASRGPRPVSVASMASRHSAYSVSTTRSATPGLLRGAPHHPHNRVDIVLPGLLAPIEPRWPYPYSNPQRSSSQGDLRTKYRSNMSSDNDSSDMGHYGSASSSSTAHPHPVPYGQFAPTAFYRHSLNIPPSHYATYDAPPVPPLPSAYGRWQGTYVDKELLDILPAVNFAFDDPTPTPVRRPRKAYPGAVGGPVAAPTTIKDLPPLPPPKDNAEEKGPPSK